MDRAIVKPKHPTNIILFAYWVIFMLLLLSAEFFNFNKNFLEYYQSENSLYPDQDQHPVGPDLGPNCLQRLAADDIGRDRVKVLEILCKISSLTSFNPVFLNKEVLQVLIGTASGMGKMLLEIPLLKTTFKITLFVI